MHTRVSRIPTIVLIVVLAVLPPAAVLQYHLLDQASKAEAASLARQAGASVRSIRSEIAYELTGLIAILSSLDGSSVESSVPTAAVEAWTTVSRFPGLIARIVVALAPDSRNPDRPRYLSYVPGEEGFTAIHTEAVAWLDDVRFDVAENTWTIAHQPFVLSAPASVKLADDTTSLDSLGGDPVSAHLFLEVARDYFTDVMVRALIAEHLGTGADAFEMAVIDLGDDSVVYATASVVFDEFAFTGTGGRVFVDELTPLLWSELATPLVRRLAPPPQVTDAIANPSDIARQAPVVAQWSELLYRLRPDDGRWAREGVPRGIALPHPEPAARTEGLVLAVWHPAGGIMRAVGMERNRNLVVSYAFLVGVAAMALLFHMLYRRIDRQRVREREFIASVTHELRTPVSAMHASAENLAEGIVTDPARIREYGRMLLEEGRRLRTLIDQTLDLAGLQSGSERQHTRRRLGAVVDDVLSGIPSASSDKVSLLLRNNTSEILVDETVARSVLANLVSNAFKHNPEGTSVELMAEVARTGNQEWLVLGVRDDGVGIPRREIRRIREPFYRGRRSRRNQVAGTGLGLSIVERVVTNVGGRLEIQSEEGRGTTVAARIPFGADDER